MDSGLVTPVESSQKDISPLPQAEPPQMWHWILLGIWFVALLGWLAAPWPIILKLQAIAFGLDPQRPAHSFFLAGTQLPLEARKVGMYGGFALTVAVFWLRGQRRAAQLPPWPILAVLVAFLATMALDGTNNFFHDLGLPYAYLPDNRLRLATGLLTGITLGSVVWPIFNMTFWREPTPSPVMGGAQDLLVVVLACVPLFAGVVAGIDALLYPVAFLGAIGLVGLVILLNVVLVLIIARRENGATRLWDFLPPGTLGLGLAILELGGLALARFILVGTAPLP